MGTKGSSTPFIGRWRIVWMSGWDQDYVDMDVPGHIAVEAKGLGHFQFGMLQAQIDYRVKDGRIAFTWNGFDEGDDICGRGDAGIVDGELQGHFHIHLGDDSAFRAVRQPVEPKATRRTPAP